MTTLICTYEMDGISKVTQIGDIGKLYRGFWVDASGNFTHGEDAEIYIMPHMIRDVRKETDESSN